MKNEWKTYLESIGIQEPFLERAKEVIDFYQQIDPDQIEDIFVTEYFDKDGDRQYESLWLFSKTSVMEAKQFLTVDNFDWSPMENEVRYWCIKKEEYNFLEASNKSRMTLEFRISRPVGGIIKASQENCDYLKVLFLKYLIPNVKKYPAPSQQMDSGDG